MKNVRFAVSRVLCAILVVGVIGCAMLYTVLLPINQSSQLTL